MRVAEKAGMGHRSEGADEYNLPAVRCVFAGVDHEKAVVAQKTGRLFARFDERSKRYESLIEPQGDPCDNR